MADLDVYDVTMDLQNNWTLLAHRQTGKMLLRSVQKNVRPQTRAIVLDFTMVSGIEKSFVDAFLVPLYREFGAKMPIIGINIDRRIVIDDLIGTGIGTFLTGIGINILFIDKTSTLFLLGAKQTDLTNQILNALWHEGALSVEQVAVRLDVDKEVLEDILSRLVESGFVVVKTTKQKKYVYYEADYADSLRTKVQRTLVNILEERIRGNVIEKGHFELPSGLHLGEFYHLSRVLQDARLARMVGKHFSSLFGELDPSFVLTAETPNNILLAHRTAQALGINTRSIFANIAYHEKKMVLHDGFSIDKSERGIIVLDTIVSGYLANQLIRLANSYTGSLLAVCSVLDLSSQEVTFAPYRYVSILYKKIERQRKEVCQQCTQRVPVLRPRMMPGDWTW